MAFTSIGPVLGVELTGVDASQKFPLGTIVQGYDPTYGVGEFIYLKGVASNVAGAIISYDVNFAAVLHTTALDKPRPVAVSMSAFDAATEYGWAQISGNASAKKAAATSFAAGAAFAGSAGLAKSAISGLILNGALVAVVASAKSDVTTVRVMLNRPHGPSDVS